MCLNLFFSQFNKRTSTQICSGNEPESEHLKKSLSSSIDTTESHSLFAPPRLFFIKKNVRCLKSFGLKRREKN